MKLTKGLIVGSLMCSLALAATDTTTTNDNIVEEMSNGNENIEQQVVKEDSSDTIKENNQEEKQIVNKENSDIKNKEQEEKPDVKENSDIVKEKGVIFAVEFAPRVARDLYLLSKKRKNIFPILADANLPLTYYPFLTKVDLVFQDIAQPNQVDILVKNIYYYLKKGGYFMLAVKSRSIDISKKPKEVYFLVKKHLEEYGLKIIQEIELNPYEKDHIFYLGKNEKDIKEPGSVKWVDILEKYGKQKFKENMEFAKEKFQENMNLTKEKFQESKQNFIESKNYTTDVKMELKAEIKEVKDELKRLENKFDRMQWLIIATLISVFAKDYILKLIGG